MPAHKAVGLGEGLHVVGEGLPPKTNHSVLPCVLVFVSQTKA